MDFDKVYLWLMLFLMTVFCASIVIIQVLISLNVVGDSNCENTNEKIRYELVSDDLGEWLNRG